MQDIKEKILSLLPEAVFEESKQYPTIVVPAEKFHAFAKALKEKEELSFDYLFCLSGVDMKTYLMTVYHMESTKHGHQLVVKVKMNNRDNPKVHTVSDIWLTADFLEREVFDLFGIKFDKHPDLRRLLLDDDFVGYPLRKDFVDDINIVER